MNATPQNDTRATILLADDCPESLKILTNHMKRAGFQVRQALSGPSVLDLLSQCSPDLILLDVMMPGMNGFELIRQIKAHPPTAEIPIIFITAKNNPDDVLTGFKLGAVDYVRKPFHRHELLARVRTHLELKQSRDQLRRMNQEKNRLVSMVSHDMRGFCGNVISIAHLAATHSDPDQAHLLQNLGMEAEHMLNLSENLLHIDTIEAGEINLRPHLTSLQDILAFACNSLELSARARNVQVNIEPLASNLCVLADPIALRQILTNFLSNAIKYTRSGTTVVLSARQNAGRLRIEVTDQGSGLNPEQQARLFQPFTRLAPPSDQAGPSAGLGLAIVQKLAQAMGARVGCQSSPGLGATFFIELPPSP